MGEPSASYKEVVRTLILADKAADLEAERERRRIEAGPRKDTEVSTESKVADAEVEVQDTLALTEEEEKMCVRKSEVPDLTSSALSRSFASFALPTAEEGFEEIAYEWQPMEQCKALLKEWVSARKLTTRVEDLQPSQWFKNHWQTWQKLNGEWRKLQGDWKDPVKRKALLQRKLDAKRKEAGADPEAELMKIDAESNDIHSVADVTDIGSGEPLFANFVFEDWTLLSTHVELHLLLHAFRKDLNDPERLSFHESHLAFYYSRYYRKPFELKYFGVETLVDFVEMVSETMKVRDDGMLEAILGEDAPLDGFLRHTEAYRRERQHRIDAGRRISKTQIFEACATSSTTTDAGAGVETAATSTHATAFGSAAVHVWTSRWFLQQREPTEKASSTTSASPDASETPRIRRISIWLCVHPVVRCRLQVLVHPQ